MESRPPLLIQLDGAVVVRGGVRAAAAAADLDASNLSKFLRYGGGLSEASLHRLEAALGRPGGRVDPAHVLVLRPRKVNHQLGHALSWYLPNGGDVARATWSGFSWERVRKTFKFDLAPEVYAIRYGSEARLLILPPAGLMLPRGLFEPLCPGLRWYGGEPERADLSFDDPLPWTTGNLDVETFDQAWPGQDFDPTLDDVVREIRRLGLSYKEVIRRLHYNN